MNIHDSGFSMRLGVHTMLFGATVLNQGNDEQIQQWQKDIENFNVLGCFGMTELGNGSFIQNFETTAIYDETTQEFRISSPTITSYKWWIGMAAEVRREMFIHPSYSN
jgi:acyl-CoA oxidase